MNSIKYLLIIAFCVVAADQGQAATIHGKIASDRIKKFDNFVVYIKTVDPKLFELPKKTVRSIQENNRFIPQVLPIVRKSKILFVNNDPELHNVNTGIGGPIMFYFGIPPEGEYPPLEFNRLGVARLSCSLHSEMRGFLLVLQNPFFSKVDENGNFKIENVPEGEYEIVTWHDEFKSITRQVAITDENNTKLVRFKY